jgi:dienelactone hydrolase
MKLLGLHGNQQNANVFYSRCTRLVEKAHKAQLVDGFTCVDGIHVLPLRDGDQEPMRAWYNRDRSGVLDKNSLQASLSAIDTAWASEGPFDGIIGFSMGGAFAAVIASLPERFPGLQFIVVAGAPDIGDNGTGKAVAIPVCVASLHYIGEADQAVPPRSSLALANRFRAPTIVHHDMGHCLPTRAAHLEAFTRFLSRCKEMITSGTADQSHVRHPSTSAPATASQSTQAQAEQQYCATDEVAALQCEEMEVLTAMFPEELALLHQSSTWPPRGDSASSRPSPALPAAQGDPCACYHISLTLDPAQFAPGAATDLPDRWRGNLGLLFRLPALYPVSEPPLVTVTTGRLALSDQFSDARVASLEAAVVAACRTSSGEFIGEACALLCVQAANDWFYTGQWRTATARSVANATTTTGGATEAEALAEEDGVDDSDVVAKPFCEEADGAAEAEMVRLATEEACRVAYEMRERWGAAGLEKRRVGAHKTSSSSAKEPTAPLLPPSARGVWGYTVGLVGKPSAGKSTFYNAVTRAALERGGRLMAAVAPHPFTTIEPNIGGSHYHYTRYVLLSQWRLQSHRTRMVRFLR